MLIGIYPRKLVFFAVIGLLIFGSVKFVNSRAGSMTVSASQDTVANMSQSYNDYYLELNAMPDGKIYSGSKEIPNAIRATSDMDELRLLVLDQPDNTYSTVKIVLNLPKKINRLYKDPEIIAVHGASPLFAKLEGNAVIFEAQNAGPSSTVTIVSQFPKGYLNLPLSKEVGRQINSIPGIIWILGGAVLPPIALIFLLIVIFGSKVQLFAKKVQGEVNKPPSRDSCALASILDYGRATEHLVMGVLVDLANRGFIDIYNQEKDFVIYQKNVSRHKRMQLKPYETILLEKIFLPKQTTVGSIDVEARLARHLYSRKLALVYLGIYDEGTSLGYFSDPPPKIHLKYRLIGIGSFFMGLLGYILFAIVSPDPKFVLFFWLSMIISGILIINFAPNITGFSRRGEILRGEWLKFKNFLSKDEILRGHDELFEKYLPYAVSMNVEAAWAARFIESNFIMPEWYNFPGEIDGVENFAKSLLPIIDYLGDALATSTDPLVR